MCLFQVFAYFKSYAEKFQLNKYIHLNTSVLKVAKADNYSSSGQWVIHSKDLESGAEKEETFDAVLLCSGHHADKYVPEFPGLSDFKGKVKMYLIN